MSEQEMLEFAAKAAGIKPFAIIDGVYVMGDPMSGWAIGPPAWSPLTDDGDAFRLAVRASIDIVFECGEDGAQVACAQSWDAVEKSPRTEWVEPLGNIGDESNAAVRRAIVRAAAEIGKAMP